jgi:hypothetical protein
VEGSGTLVSDLIKMRQRRILIRKSPWFDFFAASERNAGACRQATLRVFEHSGHNAIYAANLSRYRAALRAFLDGLAVKAADAN